MAKLIIRKTERADLPLLSALAKQTFYDTFTGTCTEEDMAGFLEEYYNESVLGEQMDSGIDYFFAEAGGVVAGYLSCAFEAAPFPELAGSTSLELKRFYLDKGFHGTGIAHEMMDFLLDHARTQGCDAVFLGVWEFNYRAQKFYSKFGFINSGHRHDFPIGNTPQTDVYLWKALA